MSTAEKKLAAIELEVAESDDFAQVPPADIVAYTELRSCADLYRMYVEKILDLSPAFQRDFVWKQPDQSRFIDSLAKALPIPSLCLAFDYKVPKWVVIDGRQRISTVVRFLGPEKWRLSNLDDIDPDLRYAWVHDLRAGKGDPNSYYERVRNLAIPITVLRCDLQKPNHLAYLFTIFHRLNTGGTKLTNQEIRNALYAGSLNQLLWELDAHKTWRKLNRMKEKENYRLAKQEVILRFFAICDDLDNYDGHLAKFLNNYMAAHGGADEAFIGDHRTLFQRTVAVLADGVAAHGALRVPNATLEALLVGIGTHVDRWALRPPEETAARIAELLAHPSLSSEKLAEGLAKKERVVDRIAAAKSIFGRP